LKRKGKLKKTMNSTSIRLEFGKSQTFSSISMARFPRLGQWIYGLFGYTNIGNWARSRVLIKILNQINLAEMKHILDLGCGRGEFATMIAEGLPQAQVTALDIRLHTVARLNRVIKHMKLKNVTTFLGQLEQIPPMRKFDFIYSVDVFEHILEEEMPFAAAYERLKPGGYLLVKMPSKHQSTILPAVWFKEHEDWLKEEHIGQVYELNDLKNRFESEGFELVYSAYADGLWSRLAWEIAYLAKKVGKVTQLLSLPFCKALVMIDQKFSLKQRGNTIQVIGRKPID
jgi:2-polyprenyl-3-methyl-5-hydroxy-6-metoxy-1,4-benzoquinol methylase